MLNDDLPIDDLVDDAVPSADTLDDGDQDFAGDVGSELVAAMLRSTDDVRRVFDAAIHLEWIGDERTRDLYRDVVTYFVNNEKTMPVALFRKRNPDVVLVDTDRDAADILYDLKLTAQQRHVGRLLSDVEALVDPTRGGNPHRAENLDQIYTVLRTGLADANAMFTTVTDQARGFGLGEDLLTRYNDRAAGRLPGIRWPEFLTLLEEDVGTLLPGHLTGFAGRPGAKKTFILLYICAMTVLTFKKRVLFYSSEMQSEESEERIVSMVTGLSLTAYTRAKLPLDKSGKPEKLADFLNSERFELLQKNLIMAGPNAVKNMADIEILATEHKIDMIGIDNAHTIQAKGEDHTRINNMMMDMKFMAMRRKAHVLYTTHQNRYGKGQASVAYGDAFNTWSSTLISTKPHPSETDKLILRTLKVRNGRGNQTYNVIFDLEGGVIRMLGREAGRPGATTTNRPSIPGGRSAAHFGGSALI